MGTKPVTRWREVAAAAIIKLANGIRGAEDTHIISRWSPGRTALWVAAFLMLAGVFWLEYLLIGLSALRAGRALLIPIAWGITFIFYWYWYVFWFLAKIDRGWVKNEKDKA